MSKNKSKSAPITESTLLKELRFIMADPSFDLEAETQKTIRQQICDRLQIDEFPKSQRGALKQLVVRLVNEEKTPAVEEEKERDSEEASDEEEEEEEVKPAKKKKKVEKKKKPPKVAAAKKKVSTTAKYGSDVQSLLDLGRALSMGPRLYHGIKDAEDDDARVDILVERLEQAGAKWNGKIPSSNDIAKAKKEKSKRDDLEGLDTSLIIEESTSGRAGRRGTRGAAVIKYNQDDTEEEEEEEQKVDPDDNNNEEVEDKEDGATSEKRPKKKAKVAKEEEPAEEEEDDDDDEEFEGGDDEESEEEFE